TMYRLLIIGMLLFAVPTLLLAQEDKAKDAPAEKDKNGDKDKAAADKDKPADAKAAPTFEIAVGESFIGMPRMQVIANVLILVLLCIVYIQGMMTRSELKELIEQMGKSSPS